MKFEWQGIHGAALAGTARAKVPGGWLVLYEACRPVQVEMKGNLGKVMRVPGKMVAAATMQFVSDPNYEWSLDDEGIPAEGTETEAAPQPGRDDEAGEGLGE